METSDSLRRLDLCILNVVGSLETFAQSLSLGQLGTGMLNPVRIVSLVFCVLAAVLIGCMVFDALDRSMDQPGGCKVLLLSRFGGVGRQEVHSSRAHRLRHWSPSMRGYYLMLLRLLFQELYLALSSFHRHLPLNFD